MRSTWSSGGGSAIALAVLAARLALPAPALAQTTPASPGAAQPSLPVPPPATPATKPGSPVVETLVTREPPALEVRKQARVRVVHLRHFARHRYRAPIGEVERPALAGVELLAPLPTPPEPPHLVVPLPAYPPEEVAAAFLTPPPPVVCHRVPRIRGLPDPHLYRETTLECVPDNP